LEDGQESDNSSIKVTKSNFRQNHIIDNYIESLSSVYNQSENIIDIDSRSEDNENEENEEYDNVNENEDNKSEVNEDESDNENDSDNNENGSQGNYNNSKLNNLLLYYKTLINFFIIAKKQKSSIKKIINLAQNIKRLISANLATDNSQSLILQPLSLDNTIQNQIVDIDSLNDSILLWKKKDLNANIMKGVVDVHIFIHIVNILQLYKAVEKQKDQIQQISKYKPKKRDTKGWVKLYLADQLECSVRHVSRYLIAANRLKDLYNQDINFNILVLAKCFLSDFWCSKKKYQSFLNELGHIQLNNESINSNISLTIN
jgi:hypothetical protein